MQSNCVAVCDRVENVLSPKVPQSKRVL